MQSSVERYGLCHASQSASKPRATNLKRAIRVAATTPGSPDEESHVCEAGQCSTGLHCEAAIGQCDGEGECSETSMLCGLIPGGDIPVCGCDGTTFESQCHAQQADMPVAAWGECDG